MKLSESNSEYCVWAHTHDYINGEEFESGCGNFGFYEKYQTEQTSNKPFELTLIPMPLPKTCPDCERKVWYNLTN